MRSSPFFLGLLILSLIMTASFAHAQDTIQQTQPDMFSLIETEASKITEPKWRNYAYRDLAVSMVFAGYTDKGIALIQKIDNSDTRAMTIRAIGMAMAIHKKLDVATYQSLFAKLDSAAKTITDEGAKDIAYTYIAMAQAFAGLDDDATKTTAEMKKPELKHKAFGETAEIQAERGDFNAALKSINSIDSLSFKNKALLTVSDIFVKEKKYEEAFQLAQRITNPTKKAEALQHILNAQLELDKEL